MQKQTINKNRRLGVLCLNGHEYENTGMSLRYKCCRTCCECNAISVEARKVQQEEYRNKSKNKKKMNKYQKAYRREKKGDWRI